MQFLADEAAGLALPGTLLAINSAIETCRQEIASCRKAGVPPARVDSLH